MEISQELALSLINSTELFPVDFEDAWRWIGYKRKDNAKKKLVRNFERGIDYDLYSPSGGKIDTAGISLGRPTENIKLSLDTFKQLAMMAGTDRGKEVRHYFLQCEKIAKEVGRVVSFSQESEEITRLDRIIEVEKLRLKQKELDNTMLSLHGAATVLTLRGCKSQLVEIEKPTLEVIDERHNVKFLGQTLKQVGEYIEKTSGIKFKRGEVKKRLQALKREDIIAQSPRSILTDYIPAEYLEEAYQLLTSGNRQLLLGE